MRTFLLIIVLAVFSAIQVSAQTDSLASKPSVNTYTHRDSVYMAKLNSNGNLMIAGGVGLCGAGSYLIYYGVKVYKTGAAAGSLYPEQEVSRNKRQGTIYLAAGGIAIGAGIILTAFGARNKVDFKTRKRMMELQSGLLDNGNLGAMLTF